MLHVYINYPHSKFSLHYDSACPFIGMMGKPGQRRIIIDADSIASELGRFQAKEYRFSSTPALNDMWMVIDLGDSQREMDVVQYVQQLTGIDYRRLRDVVIQVHCDTNTRDKLSLIGLPLRLESVLKPRAETEPTNSTGEHISEIERKLRQLEEKIRGA